MEELSKFQLCAPFSELHTFPDSFRKFVGILGKFPPTPHSICTLIGSGPGSKHFGTVWVPLDGGRRSTAREEAVEPLSSQGFVWRFPSPVHHLRGQKKKKMMTHTTSATCGQGKLNLQVLSCYCCFFLVSVETEPSATAHEALSYIPSPSLGKYSITVPHTQPVTTLPGKTSNYPVCEPALSAPLSWVVVWLAPQVHENLARIHCLLTTVPTLRFTLSAVHKKS